MTTYDRRLGLLTLGLIGALVLAIPVLGAGPSPSAAEKAEAGAKARADKGPEIVRTLNGTVVKATDAKGRSTFSLTVGGVTWELSAGPKWYWGDKNPLSAFVGKTVEVVGTHRAGETELDVDTVDGKALRAAGKPPWAGGPKVQGEIHPGWKDWKGGGKPGKGHGRDRAPGQDKVGSTTN